MSETKDKIAQQVNSPPKYGKEKLEEEEKNRHEFSSVLLKEFLSFSLASGDQLFFLPLKSLCIINIIHRRGEFQNRRGEEGGRPERKCGRQKKVDKINRIFRLLDKSSGRKCFS